MTITLNDKWNTGYEAVCRICSERRKCESGSAMFDDDYVPPCTAFAAHLYADVTEAVQR